MKRLLFILLLFSSVYCVGYTITTIDSLQIQTRDNIYYADIDQINDTTYVTTYTDAGTLDGFIATISVDSGGDNLALIEEFEFETSNGEGTAVTVVNDTTYLVVFGTASTSEVIMIDSDSNYDNMNEIDSQVLSASAGDFCDSELIDPTHAIVMYYEGDDSDLWAKTLTWNSSYVISVVDSLLVADIGYLDCIIDLDGGTNFAVSYSISGANHHVKVLSVDGSYAITEEDDLHHSAAGKYSGIGRLDNTHFALIFSENNTINQILKTFSYLGGTISQLDTLFLDATISQSPTDVELIDGTDVLYYYVDSGYFGAIGTVALDGSYNITDNSDKVTSTAEYVAHGHLFRHSATVWIQSHTTSNGCAVRTINLAGAGYPSWSHTISGVLSPTSVSGVATFTKINGVE